jgi:hypothetical protein
MMSRTTKNMLLCTTVIAGIGLGLLAAGSGTGLQKAFAAPGDKSSDLERGDKVPVIVYRQDKDDASKGKTEAFSCTVLNAGSDSKDVETLLDCKPAKVLENIAGGEEAPGALMPDPSAAKGANSTDTDGETSGK